MANRYLNLFKLPERLYTKGSPIIIEAGALHKDTVLGDIVAQIKFSSLVEDVISAINVDIVCFNAAKEIIVPSFVYEYQNISNNTKEAFFGQKTLITLPNNEIRSFTVKVTKVKFTNGKEIKLSDGEWMTIPEQQKVNKYGIKFENYFKQKYGKQAVAEPIIFEDVWVCTCQKTNRKENDFCSNCGAAYSAIFPFNIKQEKQNAVHTAKIEEENTIKLENQNKAKRRGKIFICIFLVVCIILSVFFVINNVVIPVKKKNALNNCNIGDVVLFGTYEQDKNNVGKEDMEWVVLEKRRNEVLLLSKYVIDCKAYNKKYQFDITWENCTLRNWLNSYFFDSAFDKKEKRAIVSKLVTADKNPYHNTIQGNNTIDNVFILSVSEAIGYDLFDIHSGLGLGIAVPNALKNYDLQVQESGAVLYWLRTVGWEPTDIAIVHDDGSLRDDGITLNNYIGVRPAVWIDISKIK